jgi:hypothetical protein
MRNGEGLRFFVVAVAEVTLDDINQGIEAFVDPATLFIAPPHFFPALLRFLLDSAFGSRALPQLPGPTAE